MGKIYTESGWVNWDYLLSQPESFLAVVGARGTGKIFHDVVLHHRRCGRRLVLIRPYIERGVAMRCIGVFLKGCLRTGARHILFSREAPGEDDRAVGLGLRGCGGVGRC